MNLEQSKIMQPTWLVLRTLCTINLESLKVVWLMQRMLLSKEERLPWPSSKERLRTWRLSLLLLSLALERLPRHSREPNAKPRNSPLLRERIERTKTARLSKNLRRLRNVQSLQWSCKLPPESSQDYQKM